jgi:sortase family protein
VRSRLPSRLLAISAIALIATPVAVWAARPDVNVGTLPPPTAAASPGPALSAAITTSGIQMPDVVVRSARLEDFRPAPRGSRPVKVTIASIGVQATVVPVGVEDEGSTVEVPTDVHTVGWYRFGPVPGEAGSAVLIGHVDSHVQGPGAFFRLRDLSPGDVVSVRSADGTRSDFRVVARRSYPKGHLPAAVFGRSGRPMLAMVTCGGAFDPVTRSYADNVVIFAVGAG